MNQAQSVVNPVASCRLCGHACGANREQGECGRCRMNGQLRIASFNVHHGEEPCISGQQGSGNIFFSGCVLACLHCQNYPISQYGHGRERTIDELAEGMLALEQRRCHNINLVTPTSFYPKIAEAVRLARNLGLELPIIVNTAGFEQVETVETLADWVQVYLPDMKFADRALAEKICGSGDYVDVNRAALLQMVRQAGPLQLDSRGLASRGVLIRHLVLPGQLDNTRRVLEWIALELGCHFPLSLMKQYFPAWRAQADQHWSRKLEAEEYAEAVQMLQQIGFSEGYLQE